jgi:hypothetical protein
MAYTFAHKNSCIHMIVYKLVLTHNHVSMGPRHNASKVLIFPSRYLNKVQSFPDYQKWGVTDTINSQPS